MLHTEHEAAGKHFTGSAACGVGLIKAPFCPKLAPEISLSAREEAVTSENALAGSSLGYRKKVNTGLEPRALQEDAQMP